MEEKIKKVFQYQRFSPNERLSEVIADVQCRYAQLSDEDLEMVAAAGEAIDAQEVTEHAWEMFT